MEHPKIGWNLSDDSAYRKVEMDPTRTSKGSPKTSVIFGVEEQEDEAWKMAQERKNIVMDFLNIDLSSALLKRHQTRVELLRKCSYYIEILPRHLALGDQNHLMLPITMFQLIDPWKFQRMKKVGTSQTKIQLILLADLLEQLHRGRAALVGMVQSYGTSSFLYKWEVVSHRLSELTSLLDNFLSLLVPGRLYIKHRLVSDIGATKIPLIRLVLRTKTPVVFDRRESRAHEDWVSLKWHSLGQQNQPEKYELCFKLHDQKMAQDASHGGTLSVSANSFEIRNLLRDRLYEFSVRRAETYTLVYEAWRDTITLQTQTSDTQQDMECHNCGYS
ncbi:fibronectin type III domain-containing protein 11 [Discoglossus pictus]